MTSDFIECILVHLEKCKLGMTTKNWCVTKAEWFD